MNNEELIRTWAKSLAKRLDRSETEIVEKGLSASDFPLDEEVEIQFGSGDSMRFNYAFFLVDEDRQKVAVFTEHSGYFEFPSRYLKIVATKTTVYIGDKYDG